VTLGGLMDEKGKGVGEGVISKTPEKKVNLKGDRATFLFNLK